MTYNTKWLAPYAIIITCFYCYPAAGESSEAAAEDANAQGSLAEIIVTAQKRSERVNNVPMTVTALQGDQLVSLGVKDPSDLVKVVPGLVYTKSAWGAPVYTLRGIGYYDTSLSAVPAVTIYTDQVPLPYSALTTFTTLDVQRVEVLKGPQGTLYGESSTGGAINYVANRPSDTFGAGIDFSFGRFNDATTDAFVTGPLTDTLKARLAIHNEESGDWQYSLTRPGDTHGKKNITMGRLLLDWSPTAKLSAQLNINFGLNRSDTQAPQFQTINPQNAFALFVASTFHPRFLTYPKATNPRSADWDANSPFGMDSKQHQAALTVDYAASDALTLTSISSYVNYRPSSRLDADGTDLLDLKMNVFGEITTYFQELRAHGTVSDKFNWIVGLNYSNDHILQHVQADIRDSFLGSAVVGFGLNTGNGDFRKKTKSAYVSADYEIAPRLKISAGTRVSSTDFENQNCTTADSALTAATASAIQGTPIGIGDCFTLTPLGVPGVTTFRDHESNAPWRFVVESKINPETLLYASASKGFKSGTYPNIAATTYQTNRFVKQENLLDYEAGFKATLFNRLMQVNGAAFYYDYKNKQVLGSQIDPKLGVALNTSVNIPTSRVIGSELEVTVAPITGLTLGIAGTYLDTRITGSFVNVDFLGLTRQLAGGPLPYAPRISLVARADYKHPISDKWDAYIGGLLNYKSSSNAGLGEQSLAKIDGYSTIDAQMGVESNNLRIGLWGRNITDKLYYNSAFTPLGDSIARYAGMPAEFGILFSYRY